MAMSAVSVALIYDALGEWGFMPPAVAFQKARGAAEQAAQLDPKLAQAHAMLGSIHDIYDWDWRAADRELQQALALAPNDSWILFAAARHLMIRSLGRSP
jgi:tetratricopeptide (TPR) repeat protein